MTHTLADRVLFVDESGTDGCSERNWLVFGAVDVAEEQIKNVERVYRAVCRSHLPYNIANKPELDLKGAKVFRPKRGSTLFGLPFAERLAFGRELLAAGIVELGMRFYVSAVDRRMFPTSEEARSRSWPKHVGELAFRSPYLFALCELVETFAFWLDQDMSSGIDELILRARAERRIGRGKIVIDQGMEKPIRKLEFELRRERPYSHNDRKLFEWQLLENYVGKFQFEESKKEV